MAAGPGVRSQGLLDVQVQLAAVDEACAVASHSAFAIWGAASRNDRQRQDLPVRCSRLPFWQVTSAARRCGRHTATDASRLRHSQRCVRADILTQASETALVRLCVKVEGRWDE